MYLFLAKVMTERFTLFRHFYNMQILEDSFVYIVSTYLI